jgi:proline iminopeptidase
VRYESRISELQTTDAEVDTFLNTVHGTRLSESMGLLENYYMANHCFLKEGQLLNDTDKIKDIPVVIVNGRYDVLCPPRFAYRLHKMLPKSELVIAEKAGHSAGEPSVREALLKAMRDLE